MSIYGAGQYEIQLRKISTLSAQWKIRGLISLRHEKRGASLFGCFFTTLKKLYDYNLIMCLSMFTLFMADYSYFCWNAQYSKHLRLAPSFLLSYEHFYFTFLYFSVYFTFNLPLNPILILAIRSILWAVHFQLLEI